VNRHERRKAAARARRAGVTRETALGAIRAALSPEHVNELDEAPGYVTADLVEMVAAGECTVAAAAEAWGRALELYDARERGEMDDDENLAVMAQLALRHRAGLGAD
jgi:hypothetical protein